MDDYESLSHSKWDCKYLDRSRYHVFQVRSITERVRYTGSCIRREEAEFCGPTLLGEGILRIHSRTGHRGDSEYIKKQEEEDKRLEQMNLWR